MLVVTKTSSKGRRRLAQGKDVVKGGNAVWVHMPLSLSLHSRQEQARSRALGTLDHLAFLSH